MSNVIKDGRGTGNTAEVDDHGRLYVKSNIVSHMSHHATYHKNAYIKSFNTVLAGTSDTNCALLLNNNPNLDIEIYWVRVSCDANVEVKVIKNTIYASGGNLLETENTNFNVIGDPSVKTYEGGATANLVITATNEVEIDGRFLAANDEFYMNYTGGLVLPYKKTLNIRIVGSAADKVKVTFGYAHHIKNQKL